MAATPSLKVIKSIPFKGGSRRTSNRYHFNGGTPADGTHWTTFSDAVVNAEKLCSGIETTIVETIGYAAGSDVPVFSKTYSTVGTSAATGAFAPAECAALVRYATAARTSKNHPVYLFNFYHQVMVQTSAGNQELLATTLRTELGTYAAHWLSGFSDGTLTLVRAGPNGATATGSFVEEYVTHRDFPYTPSA
jgi:hypothetical protein